MSDSGTFGAGTVLADRYELIEVVGRGGFGTVWKGRQLNMGREVAIKILPAEFMSLSDVVERFKREAQLASRLNHPNTITLHDYGQHESLLYIVMELLIGEDLADVLKRDGRLPPKRIMHIGRQVLKSLSEAHDQGIVHRDLKPENIFLSVVGDERDHVKVLDFGIAKLAQPSAEDAVDGAGRRLTMSGSTVGTPTYMSPEQAAGEEVDGLTDVYALGIIMYEMAVGRPPFFDRNPVKVMRAQIFEPVPPLQDPTLQGSLLERVILKALSKEKEDRFQSAGEMLLAMAGEPVARPKPLGVDLKSLDEPSTQDVEVDDEDISEPEGDTDVMDGDAAPRFPSTLAYAKGVQRPGPADEEGGDAVPFAAMKITKRPSHLARSRSTQSGIGPKIAKTLGALPAAPPEVAGQPPLVSLMEESHVTDDGEEANDDLDVILLTQPKQPPAAREPLSEDSLPSINVTQDRLPAEERAAAAPPQPRSAGLSPARPVPAQVKQSPNRQVRSTGIKHEDDWRWNRTGDAPQHQRPEQVANKSRAWIWILLLLLILVAVGVGLYFGGFLEPLLRQAPMLQPPSSPTP